MSSLKRAADGAEDTGEDAGAAKRCKEQPRWLRVEELFFKWYAFVCGTVAAHWLNLSYDTFIAAGMLPLYSTARQGRIIISAEVPEDQRGFDGVVFDGDVPVLAQVKDHARPIGPGALGSTCCAILRMRQTNPEVRSLIASTSGFTEELVEMDASLLNAELLHIDYEQMKTALEPPPAPFQLRGIQVEAIAALQAWLTEALRVFVLGMPPGSGKTLAVAHFLLQLAEQLALFDVVIASPTRLLVQQTEAVLRGVLPDATFVTVSSDGTTSPEAIFAGKDDGRPLIISTTFDSAHVVAAAIRLREGRDVVVFVDEAHLYNQQLEELCNSASKMCLVSGTPTGIPLDLLAEEFVEYTVSMERAAAEGLIVSPRMFYPIGADLNDDSVAAKCEFIAVTSLREDNGMRRPLIFAKDKKEGTAFIAALAAEYVTHGIRAAGRVLTGDTTQSEREGLRAWFEGGEGGNEVRFITCVHVPNQGVDFPRCDGVFLTTIANHITALQRICRAVRTYPGKQFCSVLLWMSDANLMDLAQLGLGAAHVRCITATLEATDVAKERVATVKANDQLQVLVAARGNLSYREWSWWRRTETIERLGGCVAVKMGPKVDGFHVYGFMTYQRKLRRKGLLTDAQIDCLDRLGMVWNEQLQAARAAPRISWWQRTETIERLGGCKAVKQGKHIDNFDVYGFMKRQRKLKRMNLLTDAQITRFNELGVIWHPLDEKRAGFIEEYSAIISRGERPVLKAGHPTLKVAKKLASLRNAYKMGNLNVETIEALEAIQGHTWTQYPSFHVIVKAIKFCRDNSIVITRSTSLADFEGFETVNIGAYLKNVRYGSSSITPEQLAQLTALRCL